MTSQWISIAMAGGAHLGKYQVLDGLLIVRFGSLEKRTRASMALLGYEYRDRSTNADRNGSGEGCSCRQTSFSATDRTLLSIMFDPLPPPITKDNRDIAWEVALAYRRASRAAKAAGGVTARM
jgi:hypothetical protein